MFLPCILSALLLYRTGYALPIQVYPTISSLIETPSLEENPWGAVVPGFCNSVHPTSLPHRRTLFSVAWSCLLTVFICAWTSVHPNVPPRSQGLGILRRFKLMFTTVVAPELILAWAIRQWFAARKIRDVYNNSFRGCQLSKRWTTAHGHLLTMGGFKLVNEELKRIKEPAFPGWLSMAEDWDRYYEYRRRLDGMRREFGPLTLEQLKQFVEDPDVEFPTITEDDIKDRSKGDGLSKLIAILQTSWFIAQCIARNFQTLAITELELVTLAMASLNAITFVFWWRKPLGVQFPVNVYVKAEVMEGRTIQKDEAGNDDSGVTARDFINGTVNQPKHAIDFILDPLRYKNYKTDNIAHALGLYIIRFPYRLFFLLTFPVFLFFPLGILVLLWTIKTKRVPKTKDNDTVATRVVLFLHRLRYNLTHFIRNYLSSTNGPLGKVAFHHRRLAVWYDHPRSVRHWFLSIPASFFLLVLLLITLSPLFAIFFFATSVFTAVIEIVTTDAVRHGASHVPSFYAPRTDSDRYSRMIVFALFGAIFGGIHCFAWNFTFPTRSERLLWRYTSLALTTIPFVAAPIDYALENFELNGTVGKKVRLALDIIMTILLFIYVPARLSLIAQALALLRNQPGTAFASVDWTRYIPHLFGDH